MAEEILNNNELEAVWFGLRPHIKNLDDDMKHKIFSIWMMAKESNELRNKPPVEVRPVSKGNDFQIELMDKLKSELLAMSFDDANEFLQIAMVCLGDHAENADGEFPVVYYP